MMPEAPGCSADGMNTAASTTVIATTAPVIWPIALRVASFGDRPSSVMMRSTFSITTIASSTTMPIASTMPNRVSWLIVKPSISMPRNVPSRATGITRVGMMVARMFCRNSSITRNTRMIASISVCTTSLIEMVTKAVLSYGLNQVTPGGKLGASSSILRAHRVGHVQRIGAGQQLDRERADRLAVELGVEAITLRAEADPGHVTERDGGAVGVGAQDDVAELLGRGEAPLGRHRGSELLAGHGRIGAQRTCRELHVLRLARRPAPDWPTGCSRAACPGLSQMRMAYSAPNCCVLPTPGTREIWSSTCEPTMSLRRSRSMCGLSEVSATTIRKPALALATTTPCWVTSAAGAASPAPPCSAPAPGRCPGRCRTRRSA